MEEVEGLRYRSKVCDPSLFLHELEENLAVNLVVLCVIHCSWWCSYGSRYHWWHCLYLDMNQCFLNHNMACTLEIS